jgi:DNA-directed RNA polymerase specialized sigma24 family protein
MEPEPSSHSITEVLTKDVLNEGAVGAIVEKSLERYGPRLSAGPAARIPENKRRSAGPEDAVQEAHIALAAKLTVGNHSFSNGTDIYKWLYRVVENKAVDIYRAHREEGASACAGVTKEGEQDDPARALGDRAGLDLADLPPEGCVQLAETQKQIDELSGRAEVRLQLLPDNERKIVERWLDWATFRDNADEADETTRDVRNTTFDFKINPALEGLANEIRQPMLEAIGDSGSKDRSFERFLRFYFVGKGLRLLADLREEP